MEITSESITKSSAIYPAVARLYESAFPEDERAPLDLLVNGREWNGDFRAYYADGDFAALAFNYVDDRFCYLFYLAVEPSKRKLGIGSAILRDTQERHPEQRLLLEMEELDPEADNYDERLRRSHFYQSNGLKLTDLHVTQCGVPYHVLCTDTSVTLDDYRRMWRNIIRMQGYGETDGKEYLEWIFGPSF